ncbi:sugar kinase [Saccharomonospora sp. CUA-673]|uniref:ROK family transcriptional regulator n=1 Tax=Saccharomonospora sp. CUA-673 TaxID=1904969 RepID=UPI00095D465C|nr:ROK family transcriptional regulator [Saccharomonospora sp. CUA-673]OLT43185.1 sugar kinase [Saccharomonospora sp. CUA-673]
MGTAEPAGQHTVRRHNAALVLAAIGAAAGTSRAGVAARTGLTKATVSSLVDRLVAAGLVQVSGQEGRSGPGRPGTALSLAPAGPHGLGVEVAVDYVATCLVDLTGEVHRLRVRRRDNRDRGVGRVLRRAAEAVARARVDAAELGVEVGGVGVAVPGLVETSSGLVRVAPNLGWRDVDVPGELRRRVEVPAREVMVANEANMAALAEVHVAGVDGPRSFVHVSGEIGVGAGIVLDGAVFHGVRGYGGELGHVQVSPRGARCSCGTRGCVERMAGQEAILERAGVSDLDALVARLEAGDRPAVAAVRAAADWLGVALSGALNLLDVPAVVLGGTYARLYPWLAGPLADRLSARVLSAPWSEVDVVRSRLGTEAAVRGAALSAVRAVVADPEAISPLGVGDSCGRRRAYVAGSAVDAGDVGSVRPWWCRTGCAVCASRRRCGQRWAAARARGFDCGRVRGTPAG